jgi:arylsulfatase A-like enzyme
MLVVDTLRADHLSCYGYRRLTSPHLDRLAQQGVLFEQCIAPAVPTTPAYTTILTGMDVMATRMVALQPKEPLPALPTAGGAARRGRLRLRRVQR